jgi:DNA-directed RNA polymerase sigma subunit (sigma70/sigma32)
MAARPDKLDDAYGRWDLNKRTPQATGELLREADPVIRKALTSYAGGEKTLHSRARSLAIGAFESFDPNRGVKLQSHLLTQLQPLRRAHAKRFAVVRTPERVMADKFNLERTENEFRDNNGREAADDELADKTGLSRKRIAHIRALSKGVVPESQFMAPRGEDEGGDLPGMGGPTADDIWIDYVYHDLSPVDKQILEWKTGLHGKAMLSNNEIARRLRITPGAVTQRATKITALMENRT